MPALFAALLVAGAAPGGAFADSCRPLDAGGMIFGTINGPEDPENYCFEVTLGEEQELRQIDDRHVGVFYNTGQQGSVITAEEASDAEGMSVPTSLARTAGETITLTVHHREGNPFADWAPFRYPVVGGSGWEGGFHTIEVSMSPGPTGPAEEAAAPTCHVPALHGRTLKAARRALERADCTLGPVRGRRRRGARIVRQYRRYGAVLPAGTGVGVRLAS